LSLVAICFAVNMIHPDKAVLSDRVARAAGFARADEVDAVGLWLLAGWCYPVRDACSYSSAPLSISVGRNSRQSK
jgi:hypothetical protein